MVMYMMLIKERQVIILMIMRIRVGGVVVYMILLKQEAGHHIEHYGEDLW